MLKPKLNQLPNIYNIDRLRVYKDNLFIAEIDVGAHHLLWYLQNDERTKPLLNEKINEMSVSIEGCLCEIATLEIFLK